MKKILIIGFAMLFSFGIFAQSAEKNAKYSKEAIDYMDANGIEYEIMPDAPVKVLPKGANMLTTDYVARFVENVEYETMFIESLNLLESYAYWRTSNPDGREVALAGINHISSDGYLYKWETNTSNNESSPGWTSVTRQYACPGGSTSTTIVSYCNQTNPDKTIIAYQTDRWLGETGYSADYSEHWACSRCLGNSSPSKLSFLYSVRPYTISYVQTYIVGIGWVLQKIIIYSDWVSTLTSGTYVFDPFFDICEAEDFCA